ncbi:neuropeptide FF receptor 2-like [Hydra vulgaris]|uniref:Neuropeptide FF receptor 2-like n=1 Tax=Hydra vulgaris TaxID=6087 RepID=A0ABM4C9Y1_HYDVU
MTNYFVFNLALANLAISFVVIPMTMANQINCWTPNELECKIVMPFIEHFAGVCVLTHTAISIARNIIVSQSKIGLKIKLRHVALLIVLIWIFAFIILSVGLMGIFGNFVYVTNTSKQSNNKSETNQTLFEHKKNISFACELQFYDTSCKKAYSIMVFLLTYIIPMLLTGISYFKIHRVVTKAANNLKDFVCKDIFVSRKRSSKRLEYTLIIMYTFFGTTTLPLQALYLITGITSQEAEIPEFVWPVCVTFFYLQVVLKPLVLFYMGTEYRKGLYKLLTSFYKPCLYLNSLIKIKKKIRLERAEKQTYNKNNSEKKLKTSLTIKNSVNCLPFNILRNQTKVHNKFNKDALLRRYKELSETLSDLNEKAEVNLSPIINKEHNQSKKITNSKCLFYYSTQNDIFNVNIPIPYQTNRNLSLTSLGQNANESLPTYKYIVSSSKLVSKKCNANNCHISRCNKIDNLFSINSFEYESFPDNVLSCYHEVSFDLLKETYL